MSASSGHIEVAPGVTFTRYDAVRDLNLADYSEQLDTMTKIAKKAIDTKTVAGYLCFGMSGTGKTSIVRQSVWILNNSHNIQCSRIEIKCNALALSASTVEIAKHYLKKGIFYMKRYRPMVVVFDELDALARNRVLSDPRITEFSHLVCGMIDEKFAEVIAKEGGLVVVGITNDPEGVDDAVRGRLGPTIYLPLPSLDVIGQVLQNQGIPSYKEVAGSVADCLGNDCISPRGLAEGCINVRKRMSALLHGTKTNPDEVAKEILGASGRRKSQNQVQEYERRNETWIKASALVLKHWGKL